MPDMKVWVNPQVECDERHRWLPSGPQQREHAAENPQLLAGEFL